MWGKTYVGLHVKCRSVFLQILMKVEFSRQFFFSKNTQISNFMKIRPFGAQLLHADGRTDRHDDSNNRFSQFFLKKEE